MLYSSESWHLNLYWWDKYGINVHASVVNRDWQRMKSTHWTVTLVNIKGFHDAFLLTVSKLSKTVCLGTNIYQICIGKTFKCLVQVQGIQREIFAIFFFSKRFTFIEPICAYAVLWIAFCLSDQWTNNQTGPKVTSKPRNYYTSTGVAIINGTRSSLVTRDQPLLLATIFKHFIYVCFQLLIVMNENQLKLHLFRKNLKTTQHFN